MIATLVGVVILLLLLWLVRSLWVYDPKVVVKVEEKSAKESMRARKRRANRILAVGLALCGLILAIMLVTSAEFKSAQWPRWPTFQATVPAKPISVKPALTAVENKEKWEKVRYPLKGALPAGDQQWSFAGILPMKGKGQAKRNVRVDVRVTGADTPRIPFFLVEGWAVKQQPLSCQTLVEAKRDVDSIGFPDASRNIFPMYGTPFSKALWNDSEFISTIYLQNAAGAGVTTLTTFEAGPSVQQWWVNLDSADCTSFTLEGSVWEYCWIVPIYDPVYFGSIGNSPVSPRGWTDEEFKRNFAPLGLDPNKPIPPAGEVPRMAPYCRVNHRIRSLTEVVILDRSKDEVKGPVTLGVKFVAGAKKLDKPVRVIVGMSSP